MNEFLFVIVLIVGGVIGFIIRRKREKEGKEYPIFTRDILIRYNDKQKKN